MEPFYVRPKKLSYVTIIVLDILVTIFILNTLFRNYFNYRDTEVIFLLALLAIIVSSLQYFFRKYKSKTYYIAEDKISILNNYESKTGIQLEFKDLINYQITGESNDDDDKEVLYLYFKDFQLMVDNSIYTNYEKLKGYILTKIPEERRIQRVEKSMFSLRKIFFLLFFVIIAYFSFFNVDNFLSYKIKGKDKGKSFVITSILTETPIIADDEDGTNIQFLTDSTKDYVVDITVKTKDEGNIDFIKEFWVAGDTVTFKIYEYPYKYFILGEKMSSLQKYFIEKKIQATSMEVDNLELHSK